MRHRSEQHHSGRTRGEVGLLQRLVLVLRRTGAVQQDRVRVQVVRDDRLVVGRRFDERVHVVHGVHVPPQVGQVLWYLELIDEVLAGDSNVLQFGDQLEIEAADVVAGEEFGLALAQVLVDRVQVLQQAQLGLRLVSRQSEFEFLRRRERCDVSDRWLGEGSVGSLGKGSVLVHQENSLRVHQENFCREKVSESRWQLTL